MPSVFEFALHADAGGLSESIVDGETGLLVEYDPGDPAGFEADIAARVNELVSDPRRADSMGRAGRARAVTSFDWGAIADQTVALYRSLL